MQSEQKELSRPVAIAILVAIAIILIVGGIYLVKFRQ